MSRRLNEKTRQNASDETTREKFAPGEWWEWIAILAAIVALWPKILRWQGLAWDFILWVAMALMIYVLIRRLRRMRRTLDDPK